MRAGVPPFVAYVESGSVVDPLSWLCVGSSTGFCISSSVRYSRTVRLTCAASANCSLGMRLSLEAFASTKVPSTDSLSPLGHDFLEQLLEHSRFLEASMAILRKRGVM